MNRETLLTAEDKEDFAEGTEKNRFVPLYLGRLILLATLDFGI